MLSLESMRYRYPGAHIHNGMVLPAAFPSHRIEAAKTYTFHPSDVVIATYPKSGNLAELRGYLIIHWLQPPYSTSSCSGHT